MGESEPSPTATPRSERTDRPLEPRERTALLDALAHGLEEALHGVEVLDRGLLLDEGVRADLAGVDPSGRLVVALLADPDADRAALGVLDLMAWVRDNGAVLARHLDAPGLRSAKPARLVVVLAETPERLRSRLQPLARVGVELLGLRTIQSLSGERVYLTSLDGPRGADPPAGDPGEAFVGLLPSGLRGLARHAVERIARLDDELETLTADDSIAWRFRGQSLVRLERSGDALQATLGPEHEPHALRREADVEALLEGALSRLVPMFSLPPTGGRRADGPRPAPSAFPVLDEPLLTREEIDAFRQ